MTDQEEFVKLLNRFGIPFRDEAYREWIVPKGEPAHSHYGPVIGVEFTIGNALDDLSERCDKISGYGGFYQTWRFNREGKFVKTGVWE